MDRALIQTQISKNSFSEKDFRLFAYGQFNGEVDIFYSKDKKAIFAFEKDEDAELFEVNDIETTLKNIIKPVSDEESTNDILTKIRKHSSSFEKKKRDESDMSWIVANLESKGKY